MASFGTARISVDGITYSSNGEFDIKIQNEKFETMVDEAGNIHTTSTNVVSSIGGSLYLTAELTPDVITYAKDATIQVELKDGRVALLSHGVYVGDGAVNPKDGTFEVSFEGVGKWLK